MRLRISVRDQINLFLAAAFVLFLAACQSGEENGTASVRLSLDLSPPQSGAEKTASAPAPAAIGSIRIEVTGPQMSPVSIEAEVNPNQEVAVRLEIPTGPARRFVVTAFGIEKTPRFQGETTVDLTAGSEEVNLKIAMVSLDIIPAPTIRISPKTAVVAKDKTQTFSVTGIDLSQVQFDVTNDHGWEPDPELLGSVAANGVYTPPPTILTDGKTPIGNPIPVTVTAINSAMPTDLDSATVTLTTGSLLTFQKNERVTPRPGSILAGPAGQRRIAFYQGKVYAVWSNGFQILFSETADGVNWSAPPIEVTFNDSGVASPSLAVSREGIIYVAYVVCPDSFCFPTIELAVRPSSGGDFVRTPLDTRSSPEDPTVAVSPDGVVFVAWSDIDATGAEPDIYLQRIPDAQGSKKINTDTSNVIQSRPAISISDSGEIFLAWEDARNQQQQIFATASVDGGGNFFNEIQISTACCFPSNPTLISGPPGTAHVAWQRFENDFAFIFFNTVTIGTNGPIAGNEKPVGTAKGNLSNGQIHPSIALDGTGGIYIAFSEIYEGFNFGGIFLAKSIDGGNTFTFSDHIDDGCIGSTCVPTQPDESFPSLAVDSAGRAFAIWNDRRFAGSVDYDILFAKGE